MAQITLNSTGVASNGALVLQSNGTTTAVTVSTGQVATLVNDAVVNGLTVGRGAGAVSTNTAVGASALAANTSGLQNTAVGQLALRDTIGGTENTAIGRGAAYQNTSGSKNSVLGTLALQSNSTGSNNTAIGQEALQANTTAFYNTAVGYQASFTSTTATENVSVGYAAAKLTTTGSQNCAFGNESLISNTTGSSNTAVGHQSLIASTTSSTNTAVGYRAGYTNITGADDTLVGARAGYNLNASSNTFVGKDSGFYVTSGAKNTIIGRYDGNQGGLDIRTASNNIVLSDGDGAWRAAYFSTGTGNSWVFSQQATPVYQNASDVIQVDTNAFGNGIRVTGTSGTTAMRFFNQTGSAIVGSISFTGSTTTYSTSSDYRLKENVTPMTGALAKVAQLKPVTYKWKSDGLEGEGFIAHELAEVCPHAVVGEKDALDENGDPDYQGIDTSFLVATLTAAIQELKAEFDAYKATHP